MTRDENTYCGKHAEAQVIQSQFKMPTRSFQSIAQILSHSTVLSMKLFSSIISRHWNISKQVHLHARFLEIYGNLRCPTPEQSLHWSRYTWSKDIESYGIRSTLSTGQGDKARWWESQITDPSRSLGWLVVSLLCKVGPSLHEISTQKIIAVKGTECPSAKVSWIRDFAAKGSTCQWQQIFKMLS